MTEHPDAYVGPDRRQQLPRTHHEPNRRLLVTVTAAVLLYGIGVPTAVAEVLGPGGSVSAANIAAIVCAVLFAQGGLLLLLRWRLTGNGRSFHLGVASMVYGFFIAPLTEGFALLGVDVVHRAVGQSLAQSCVGIVAAVIALRALGAPEVDSRLQLGRSIAVATGALAVVCAAAYVVDQSLPLGTHHLFASIMAGLAACIWLGVGVAVVQRGRRGKLALSALLAGPFLVLGAGSVAWLLSMSWQVPFSLDASALTMAAGLLLAGGATYALLSTLSEQGASAFRLRALLQNLQRYRAFEEERVHDARSALLAVQTAISALTRYREHLDDQSRTNLEVAVDAELRRLVGLMATSTAAVRTVEPEPFDVAEPVMAVTTAAAAFGITVELDLPDDGCWALGNRDDTARVLETLVDNARRYASDSPIGVRVRGDGRTVQLAVSDRGPGIDPDERDVVFARGGRGRAAAGVAGSGLGLFTARRLMEDQDGSLTLGEGGPPGATFVVRLPAAPAETPAADERSSALPSEQSSPAPAPAPARLAPWLALAGRAGAGRAGAGRAGAGRAGAGRAGAGRAGAGRAGAGRAGARATGDGDGDPTEAA